KSLYIPSLFDIEFLSCPLLVPYSFVVLFFPFPLLKLCLLFSFFPFLSLSFLFFRLFSNFFFLSFSFSFFNRFLLSSSDSFPTFLPFLYIPIHLYSFAILSFVIFHCYKKFSLHTKNAPYNMVCIYFVLLDPFLLVTFFFLIFIFFYTFILFNFVFLFFYYIIFCNFL